MIVQRTFKWLAIFTAIWMFFVLLGGALVTKTDSGQGCGDDWPLCNGKFVPAYTIESMIEYSHRVVSAIVGILVVILFVWVMLKWRHRKDVVLYASTTLFFTVFQGLLGAAAVVWGQNSAVMALHFGFSLLAFSTTLLMAIAVSRIHLPSHPSGWGEEAIMNGPRVTKKFRYIVWLSTVGTYIVVYTGAYVRHTESWAGCHGWPLCNGSLWPSLSGATGIAFMHRLATLLLFILILYLFYRAFKNYGHIQEIRKSANWVFLLMILQVISGAFVVFSLTSVNMHLLSGLIHTVIVAGLFGIQCYMSVLTWQLSSMHVTNESGSEVNRTSV